MMQAMIIFLDNALLETKKSSVRFDTNRLKN